MILTVLSLLAKVLVALLAFALLKMVMNHFWAVKRVKFYTDQGIKPLPEINSFPFGNALTIKRYVDIAKANVGKSITLPCKNRVFNNSFYSL